MINLFGSFYFRVMNSVVVAGLYYGFLTSFSVGFSYLFLIRARLMEKGAEKQIAATTGFITGQTMMFISIYYVPLHLALSRPHTIIALTLPYLYFNFLDKNDKHYYLDSGYMLDYGYKNQNSIQKFSVYKVFFNNLVFQLLNPIFFSSSILIRLVNIYLFRCNNKLLFLTTTFVGWLIGHIFLTKCIEMILVWLHQHNLMKSKVTIRFDKYIMFQFQNYAGQIFAVFSFITFLYYLGRIPTPYFLIEESAETQKEDQMDDSETEKEKKEFLEEDRSSEEETDVVGFQNPLLTTIFDLQRWTRPLRYIKSYHFDNFVRNENSQFYFHISQSDGKERISFTYPPNLSTFLKIMEKKMELFTRDKISNKELFNSWSSTNKEKRKKLSNEFLKRAKVLDKEFRPDVLENRIRLCNDENKRKYLPKIYDPFLNGCFRGEIKKSFSPSIQNQTDTTNSILINKIHGILLSSNSNSPEFDQKTDPFDQKSVLNEIGFFFNLISKFSEKSVSSLNLDELSLFKEHEHVKMNSEEKKRKKEFLFDAIRTDQNDETVFNAEKCIGINEISKKVPRWSYNLIDELEELMQTASGAAEIRSRSAERIVVFDNTTEDKDKKKAWNFFNTDNNEDTIQSPNELDESPNEMELSILKYTREPDFSRDLIRGSMRPQRRKVVTWKFFQSHPHSPVFMDKIQKSPFFWGDLFYDISQYLKEYFRKEGTDNSEFLAFDKGVKENLEEEQKTEDERRLIEIEEAWESILYGLILRSFVIIAQSYLRKYIILPSLIITKNIIRILLFQNPEWSEDFRDWKKEVHIICTYQGVPVSNKEFPKNWVMEGLQIRILSPFVLKPWHKSKVQSTEKKKRLTEKKRKNLWFLTACGTQIESYLDNYFPNPFSFFGPIFKKIKKQLKRNLKNSFFRVVLILNKRFLTILKGIGKWNIKNILFGFQNRYELSETKKNSTISKNNSTIYESPILSDNWPNSSFTEKRIRDLNLKTMIIKKQTERMIQEKNREVITSGKSFDFRYFEFYEMESDPIFELQKNIFLLFFGSGYGSDPRLEYLKNIFQIFRKIYVRLTRKSYCFFQIFMERIYMDILLWILRTSNNVELFLESTKESVNKSISDKKTNAKRINKTNQSIIPFMSIIQKSCNITDMNSQNSCDVSSLSQAYVFYKLSQTPVSNLHNYKLRSILESGCNCKGELEDYLYRLLGKEEYNPNLLKNRNKNLYNYLNELDDLGNREYTIKIPSQPHWWIDIVNLVIPRVWVNNIITAYLKERQKRGLLVKEPKGGKWYLKPKHKHLVTNQCLNWLRSQYQYDLPESIWSGLALQKWRNRINEHRAAENKDLIEYDSDEKTRLILYKKQQPDLDLLQLKRKIKKQYRYDLFAYKFLNYADKQKSYFYGYTAEKSRAISLIYKNIPFFYGYRGSSEPKQKPGIFRDFYDDPYKNELLVMKIQKEFSDIRKEFSDIRKEFFKITGDISMQNYITEDVIIENDIAEDVIIDREKDRQKDLDRKYFNWTVMDVEIENKEPGVEIKNHSISNPKFRLFSKFGRFYDAYKKNPWIIPIKSLFFTFYGNEFELDTKNGAKAESASQVDLQSFFSNEEEKKRIDVNRYRDDLKGERNFLLEKYLGFHLNYQSFLQETMMNNIQLFCLLVRLKNYKKFLIISIQKGELNLDTMAIPSHTDFTFRGVKHLRELREKQIFFIEPVRLSRKNYEKFFMYQTISPSLVHKSEREIFQRNPEKTRLNKNHCDLLVPENILSSRRRRELRILMLLNPQKTVNGNTINDDESKINNSGQVLAKKKKKGIDREIEKEIEREKKKLMSLKLFLWPNYRLEDLACLNRYWFDTHNGSRFSILRLHMYPRFKS
uniref:Protein TIC 214 n=1 Tax=Onobrychis viciifolia TaxID=3882 RepID=A0A7S8WK24_ONOVI|nr:Ycf1 protein [Onobrychis viciifolia]